MKNLIISIAIMLSMGSLGTSCVYEDEPELVANQESPIVYVLTVTNLKPSTQDLFAETSAVAVPNHPSTTTIVIRKLPSTSTELSVTTASFFLFALKTKPSVLVPAVQGVDYTAVITGV